MVSDIKNIKGLTLIELLVVLSIAAVLMFVAVPSFELTVKKNSVRALQRNYISALAFARGEAVSRNKNVAICSSPDGANCGAAGDWTTGWLVFIDNGAGADSGNFNFDVGEELLRVFEYEGRSRIVLQDPDNGFSDLVALGWNYRGFMRENQRALVTFCDQVENNNYFARGILIERSGRVILTRDMNADGVHESMFEDGSNTDLSCT